MRTERLCPVCHPPTFQLFWRCAHHPSCIDNFFAERKTCEWECHTQTLKPYHGGFQPPPKSWPAPCTTATVAPLLACARGNF